MANTFKWNKLYQYPASVRSLIEDQRHYAIGSTKLPSVTTILSATQSEEKKASLAKWKAKVGDVQAEAIRNDAALRGTSMHSQVEHYLNGGGLLDLTNEGQEASSMAKTIIEQGLKDLQEIWASEATLYYDGLYAGATDMVGIYMGRDSIIDLKQTNKPKKIEWVKDYLLQLAAYAMAHDSMHNTQIEQGVILMCSKDNFFQRFIVNGKEFKELKWEWLSRVDQFYSLKK